MSVNPKFRAAWWWKLKQLGYDVIPLFDKEHPYKGWPEMANDAAAVQRWNGAGAAIRMRGSEMLVIDLDVHVAEVRDKMLAWMDEHHPDFMDKCLRRHSERISIALIGRAVTAKSTQKTARYLGEGTSPKGDLVEIFTRQSKGYVGVAGRHSESRWYGYHGRHITETPVSDLPWLADSGIASMLAAFEQIMVDCGWEKVIPVIGNEAAGTKVYDLLPEWIFTLSDGEKVTLKKLEQDFEGYVHASVQSGGSGKITGYADLWDPTTGSSVHSKSRVIVTIGGEGLCLFDTKYEVRHRWKSAAPRDLTKFAKMLRELMEQMEAKAAAKAAAEEVHHDQQGILRRSQ